MPGESHESGMLDWADAVVAKTHASTSTACTVTFPIVSEGKRFFATSKYYHTWQWREVYSYWDRVFSMARSCSRAL